MPELFNQEEIKQMMFVGRKINKIMNKEFRAGPEGIATIRAMISTTVAAKNPQAGFLLWRLGRGNAKYLDETLDQLVLNAQRNVNRAESSFLLQTADKLKNLIAKSRRIPLASGIEGYIPNQALAREIVQNLPIEDSSIVKFPMRIIDKIFPRTQEQSQRDLQQRSQ